MLGLGGVEKEFWGEIERFCDNAFRVCIHVKSNTIVSPYFSFFFLFYFFFFFGRHGFVADSVRTVSEIKFNHTVVAVLGYSVDYHHCYRCLCLCEYVMVGWL